MGTTQPAGQCAIPGFETDEWRDSRRALPGNEAGFAGKWGGPYWEPRRVLPGFEAEISAQAPGFADDFRP